MDLTATVCGTLWESSLWLAVSILVAFWAGGVTGWIVARDREEDA